MPKYIDDVYIQRRVITYIACQLGEEVVHTMKGSKSRTRLNSVIIEARAAVCPTVANNTLRAWWHYFLAFGYTPADARKKQKRRGRKALKRYKTRWTKHTTVILKSIVDDDGSQYLDEMQQELFELSGDWWDPSTISRKLHTECEYTLQMATDIASQKDEQEQAEFIEAVRSRLTNPN